jgi:hypothetical protein
MDKNRFDLTKMVLWAIYIFILASMLKHTAWAFGMFEPTNEGTFMQIPITGWILAIAFECSIIAFTHKWSIVLSQRGRITKWSNKVKYYINPFSAGLFASMIISSIANFAHAAEFTGNLEVFTKLNIPPIIYQLAFGAFLPLVNFLYALVLSSVTESEHEQDTQLKEAKGELSKVKRELATVQGGLKEFKGLFSEVKTDKIKALKKYAPSLSNNKIAEIVGATPSHVSATLSSVRTPRREQKPVSTPFVGEGSGKDA